MIQNAYRPDESEMAALRASALQSASALSDEDLLRATTFFDSANYLRNYPDVAAAGFDPVRHYLQSGATEGRDPSRSFSTNGYLRANPDVAAEGLNPLVHYLRLGILEEREVPPPGAENQQLSSIVPGVVVSGVHRALLESSSLFDVDYYLGMNADVAASDLDPIDHYLTVGAKEGRNPSESFSTLAYLRRHTDVAAAGLNPLVHYLEIGKSEGRVITSAKPLVPTFAQLYEARWPYLSPIPVLHVRSSERRLTVFTDSVSPSHLFGGVGTALILGALVASKLKATLRIATRLDAPDGRALSSLLDINQIPFDGSLELSFVPDDGSLPLPLTESDVFLSTSWWTTRATLGAVQRNRVAYLLQEDERMFYPFGDERLLCAETLQEPALALVINTRLLSDHLGRGEGALSGVGIDSVAFEPAFPGGKKHSFKRGADDKRKFFFYSRPNNGRNLFWRGVTALSEAIEDGVLDPAHWEFFFVGKDTPHFTLPRGAKLNIAEGLSWSEYQTLVGDMDAALVLMDTPHPSYPPLDLASAGVAVLTNIHPGKSDLSAYSKNILMAEPTREGLKDGLMRVARLGTDESTRQSQRNVDGVCRDWNVAFASTVDWLVERYSRGLENQHVS